MPRTNEGGKEALAGLLREFPTWGDAALHYKAENERLRAALHKARDRLMQIAEALGEVEKNSTPLPAPVDDEGGSQTTAYPAGQEPWLP